MALRNGAINKMVSTPHIPLAHQCMCGIILRTNGSTNENITAMVAMDSIE